MFFIRIFLCFFAFGHFAFSEDSPVSPAYFETLLKEEDVKVDCSNILRFMQSYFELSDKSHSLLSVSFNRFVSVISDAQKMGEEMEKLKKDVRHSSRLIGESQFVLSNKAGIIMEVLRDCLKKPFNCPENQP